MVILIGSAVSSNLHPHPVDSLNHGGSHGLEEQDDHGVVLSRQRRGNVKVKTRLM